MSVTRRHGRTERWVLGFDASCGQCARVSSAVATSSGRRIEVLPLTHPDVERARTQALGANPPWTPTLLRIRANGVRAWTGPALGLRLVGRLGPRPTVALLSALGDLRRASGTAHGEAQAPGGTGPRQIGRARFLRMGAGLAVGIGLVVANRATAAAESTQDAVRTWLDANRGRMPTSYDDVVGYPVPLRRAIFQSSAPEIQTRFWTDHLARYRAEHPALTAEQHDLIDQTAALAAVLFAATPTERTNEERTRLERAVKDSFGLDEARRLVATLGPEHWTPTPETQHLAGVDYGEHCECSYESQYCATSCIWAGCGCWSTRQGCGWLYSHPCDSWCGSCF